MAPLDAADWLKELASDAPCGPNLELDPEFGALERAAAGRAGSQYGDTVTAAQPPVWAEVDALASAMLERTRDLRVLVHLAIARLNMTGLAAYAEVLGLTAHVLDAQWDHVHPQLDAEDDHDPTMRRNALGELGHPRHVLQVLRDVPLAHAKTYRMNVSWRDVAVAKGTADPLPDGQRLTEAQVQGAFGDAAPEQLEAVRGALRAAIAALDRIGDSFAERVGDRGAGPNYDILLKLLREMAAFVDRYGAAASGAETDPAAVVEQTGATGVPGAKTGRGGVSAAMITSVASRTEALRLLDIVCAYYERHEPSSPLPFLIARARRLADMNFLDVLRDIAPDGLEQARIVTGTPKEPDPDY